jgi:hypothetical protein
MVDSGFSFGPNIARRRDAPVSASVSILLGLARSSTPRRREASNMPIRFSRTPTIVRLSALFAALLIAAQVVAVPAAAAPARDDHELIAAPAHDEDEAAVEPADEDEAAVEPTDEDVEVSVAPTLDEDEEAATPPQEDDEEVATPPQADDEEAAAPPQEETETAAAHAHVEEVAVAAPVHIDDAVENLYLRRLLDAINRRRDRTGTQHLSFVPASANAALDGFLAETVPVIRWPGPCGHHLVGGAFSWDYVQAAGFGGDPRGEVLACPGPEPYWTPDRAADQWWDSPIHFDVLYADPYANALACSAYGVSGGGGKNKKRNNESAEAASAVLCVTFRS